MKSNDIRDKTQKEKSLPTFLSHGIFENYKDVCLMKNVIMYKNVSNIL